MDARQRVETGQRAEYRFRPQGTISKTSQEAPGSRHPVPLSGLATVHVPVNAGFRARSNREAPRRSYGLVLETGWPERRLSDDDSSHQESDRDGTPSSGRDGPEFEAVAS